MGNTVPMIAPDGTIGDVPQERVQEAVKSGFKMGAELVAPNGQRGVVPMDSVHDAMKKGFQLAPPGMPDTVGNIARNMHGQKFNPVEAIAYAVSNPKAGFEAMGRGMQQTERELQDTSKDGMLGTATKTVADASLGAIKAGVRSGIDVANVGINGVNKVGNALDQAHVEGDIPEIEKPAIWESTSTAQKVGSVAEEAAEWMGGEAAVKGVFKGLMAAGKFEKAAQLIQKYPKILGVLETTGRVANSATTGAALGAIHNPDDMVSGAEEGAATGAVGGTLGEALGFLTKKGAGLLRGSGKNAGEELLSEGNQLVDNIAGGKLGSQSGVVNTVKSNLDDAEKLLHDTYDTKFSQISNAAKDIRIDVANSPLQKTAKELLGDSAQLPKSVQKSLKGVVPDKDKIEPLLNLFSKGADAKGNPLSMSWQETEAARQAIGKTIRDLPQDSPIRPDLIKLRGAIDETMQTAAQNAGSPEIASQISAARGEYANGMKLFNQKSIVALRNSNPNAVADILMNKQSIDNVNTLRNLIGPENMKQVEASLLDRMLQKATTAEGTTVNPKALANQFKNLAPDVKQAIWGDRLGDIQRLMNAAGKADKINASGLLQFALIAHGGYRVATGKEDFLTGAELMLGLNGHGRIALAGKALSNPRVTRPLTRLLEVSAKGVRTPAARAVINTSLAQLMNAVHRSHTDDTATEVAAQ